LSKNELEFDTSKMIFQNNCFFNTNKVRCYIILKHGEIVKQKILKLEKIGSLHELGSFSKKVNFKGSVHLFAIFLHL